MKRNISIALLIATLASFTVILLAGTSAAQTLSISNVHVQSNRSNASASLLSPAFTYQGLLKDNQGPVNGSCDFQFSLWDSTSNLTGQMGITQTRTLIAVSNGLFTIPDLDFGRNAFNGEARWLQIGVRCPGGSGSFVLLTPRQALAVAPYAIYSLNNWALNGNANTNGTGFIGTTDNVSLTVGVSGTSVLRLEPNAISPNFIAGYEGNWVMSGTHGAAIGGGGENNQVNSVTGHYGTIGGGLNNAVTSWFATIGGGAGNRAGGEVGETIGGGMGNSAGAEHATVAGGYNNRAGGENATVAGGRYNLAGHDGTVAGGSNNSTGTFWGSVGGGNQNAASGTAATIPGGWNNTAQGNYSFAAGRRAHAAQEGTFVWGDSTDANITSSADDQYIVRANGGIWLGWATDDFTPTLDASVFISTSTGAYLSTSGQWVNAGGQHSVVVNALGTPTENGTALLNALAGISDASATNPYLLKIGPGIYDLLTTTLQMKPYVDIEGSGELATTVTALHSCNHGTITGSDNAELRFLTVASVAGPYADPCATGIRNDSASPRLAFLTVKVQDATYCYGVYNSLASPQLKNVVIEARPNTIFPASYGKGLYNDASSPMLSQVVITVHSGRSTCGVCNVNTSSPKLEEVNITVSGGEYNIGIDNQSSSLVMNNAVISAAGVASNNRGIQNASSSITVIDANISASTSGPGVNAFGIDNTAGSGVYTVTIDRSQITGSSSPLSIDSHFVVYVGATQLSGGSVVTNSGMITCAGVYDENYMFYANTCP